ncbi:UNVERIFIED_CONTAM: hypothetical protein Sradi_0084700 [Sesamum radiatum]|uniref:Uncharacterized protein n=1 Tax=Sesamum radiatum TaxID=300843 RepID=A0AAW2WIW8_SESRA
MAANTVMATFLILMFVYSPALMPCDADRLTLQAEIYAVKAAEKCGPCECCRTLTPPCCLCGPCLPPQP